MSWYFKARFIQLVRKINDYFYRERVMYEIPISKVDK